MQNQSLPTTIIRAVAPLPPFLICILLSISERVSPSVRPTCARVCACFASLLLRPTGNASDVWRYTPPTTSSNSFLHACVCKCDSLRVRQGLRLYSTTNTRRGLTPSLPSSGTHLDKRNRRHLRVGSPCALRLRSTIGRTSGVRNAWRRARTLAFARLSEEHQLRRLIFVRNALPPPPFRLICEPRALRLEEELKKKNEG
jgi:hypothetical protein